MNWTVEVCRDAQGRYVFGFFRYATQPEAARLLGDDYAHPATPEGTRPTRPEITTPITRDGTAAQRTDTPTGTPTDDDAV
ncbi:MAG: hypothetical protein ACO3FT_08275 [Ilumatobacteraceae bacterium]